MPEGPLEPSLDAESLKNLQKGVDEFNSGRFFECHDTLEDIWQGIRGPSRDFFQGLIQVSVGYYHIRNGNLRGGESQLTKGLKNLSGYGACYLGVELTRLRLVVEAWLERIRIGTVAGGPLPDLPKFQYVPSGSRR
jgi:hypothetical protein